MTNLIYYLSLARMSKERNVMYYFEKLLSDAAYRRGGPPVYISVLRSVIAKVCIDFIYSNMVHTSITVRSEPSV